jgi:hypothetical protein
MGTTCALLVGIEIGTEPSLLELESVFSELEMKSQHGSMFGDGTQVVTDIVGFRVFESLLLEGLLSENRGVPG